MEINYTASPTGKRFHQSDKFIRGFMGPVGNGKTVACIMEGLTLSAEQWPNNQGVRKSRGIIVRNTGPELRTTVLNTWRQWIPEDVCSLVMHPIITGTLKQPLADGTSIELEVYFLAMDNDKDVKKLLSLESTWIFLNEARELPYSVVKAARERVGRYPSKIDGYGDAEGYKAPRGDDGEIKPCRRKAVLMDTNPMDNDHWWYQLAEVGYIGRPKNPEAARSETARVFDFFRGPAALLKRPDGSYAPNPNAENIKNLDGGYQYYLDMIGGNTDDHINVMILGNYGTIVEGRPVYHAYRDSLHCPGSGVKAIKGLPIGIGWDYGLTPAVAIGQMTPRGQLRVVAELVSEDMDVRTFARDVVKPFLSQYFKDYEIAFSLGDPAGNNRGEGEGKSSIGILNDDYVDADDGVVMEPLDLGFYTEEAPTNDPTLRINAVQQFMTRIIDGEPGYLLNKACTVLRKAKNGGYCYKRMKVSGSEEKYRDKPDKNKYSHVSDAEQYLALGFTYGYVREGEEEEYLDEHRQHETSAMGY